MKKRQKVTLRHGNCPIINKRVHVDDLRLFGLRVQKEFHVVLNAVDYRQGADRAGSDAKMLYQAICGSKGQAPASKFCSQCL